MPINEDDKLQLIDNLQAVRRAGQKLEVRLRLAGKKAEADRAHAETERLNDAISRMIAKVVDEWVEQADANTAKLGEAADKAEKAIDDVKAATATMKSVVDAVGYIDDALEIAKKVAKYL
jgi:methyl-accepting chemotaxis protein